MVLREPHVLKPVLLSPHDLVENLTVELIVGPFPGWRVTEVVPQTKAEFSIRAHVCFPFPIASSI